MSKFCEWLTTAAKDRGAERALVYHDTYLSYRGLAHRVERRAREFVQLGIRADDWVGLELGNVPDLVVLTLAVRLVGAVPVPLDPATSAHELDMLFAVAPLRAVITRPLGESPGLRRVEALRPGVRVTPLALRATDAARAHHPRRLPEQRKRLSGSLLHCNVFARATGAIHGDQPAPAVAHVTAEAGGDPKCVTRGEDALRAIGALLVEGLGLRPGSQLLVPTPLHNGYAFDLGLAAGLAAGATLVLEDEMTPRRLLTALREQSFDLMIGTPALYGAMLRESPSRPSPGVGGGSARFLCLRAPGSQRVASAFAERFGARLLTVYHHLEAGPLALDGGAHPESAGVPLPGVSIRVRAPDGGDLPVGVPGQLWVHSPGTSSLSVPPPPRALRTLGSAGVPIGRCDRDGWLRTGDLGLRDGGGRIVVDGREDDLASLDGKRVDLGEVESCLESFGRIRQAQARVVYDDLVGPMIVARVVPEGRCRLEDVIDHCARALAPYKVPRAIEFRDNLDQPD